MDKAKRLLNIVGLSTALAFTAIGANPVFQKDQVYTKVEPTVVDYNSDTIPLEMIPIPEEVVVAAEPEEQDPLTPEMRALLRTISQAEGADYNIMYGGGTFTDMSNHPIYTGEMPESGIERWNTRATPAGAYMFRKVTFDYLVDHGQFQNGFTHEEQDRAGEYLVTVRRGVSQEDLEQAIDSGNFDSILASLSYEWSSLPVPGEEGGRYGQGSMNTEEFIITIMEKYNELVEN